MRENKSLPAVRRRKADKLLMLLAAMYFLGVIFGTILYCTADTGEAEQINSLAAGAVEARLGNSFRETVINSFSGAFLLLMICFLLGFCTIAVPMEIFLPMFRGLGTGIVIAGSYGKYGLRGIGAAAVFVIPGAVMTALVLIMASREAARFSAALYGSVFGKAAERERPDVKLYFTKFVILCIGLAAASIADGAITLVSAGSWTSMV